ncbi:MAG TPA: apolipoprotein N-acyltransferase, partial [Thermoanaerobaculia bacterium]
VPVDEQWEHLRALTLEGLVAHPEADLVVWPETMYPYGYLDGAPPRRFGFPRLARDFGRAAIYGINTFSSRESRRGHNSAVLVDGRGEVRGTYRKQRLVPMGEDFLPRHVFAQETCDRWFEWLAANIGYPRNCDLERGEGYVTLDAGEGLRCAVLICFEGLYPDMARAAAREGRPDLLLHLVNNGWFGPFEPRQAVASWVFRAVETRMPFLSCANAGITCAIGPDGRILGRVDRVMEDGFLLVRVPPRGTRPGVGPLALPLALAFAALGFLARDGLRKGRPGGAGGPPGPS